jgi:hypothetical protein
VATFIDCAIGPPRILIVDCFYPTCPGFRTPIHGPECCDYTCPAGLSETEVTILAVCLSAFGLVVIIAISAIVVICCVVCKHKSGRVAGAPAATKPQYVPVEEKVDLSNEGRK